MITLFEDIIYFLFLYIRIIVNNNKAKYIIIENINNGSILFSSAYFSTYSSYFLGYIFCKIICSIFAPDGTNVMPSGMTLFENQKTLFENQY